MNDARFTSWYRLGLHGLHGPGPGQPDQLVLKDARPRRKYLVYRLQHVAALDQQWGCGARARRTTRATRTAGAGRQHLDHQHRRVRRAGPAVHDGDHVQPGGFRRGRGRRLQVGPNKLTQIASILFQGHHTTAPPRRPPRSRNRGLGPGQGLRLSAPWPTTRRAAPFARGWASGGGGPLPGQVRDVSGIATAAVHLGAGDHEEVHRRSAQPGRPRSPRRPRAGSRSRGSAPDPPALGARGDDHS